MDDQMFDVTATAVENAQITNERINAPSVLRGIEGGSLHFITVPTGRDQEFIDHSLLNPEYITTHIPNGFIIDFMSSQDGTGGSDENSSSVIATTAGTTHFITESSGAAVIQHQQQQQHHHHHHQQQHHHHHHHDQQSAQQQQHHLELHHQQQNDDQDRKLTAAFLQFVNNKSYPVKIAANEAQVIVTNKDVLAQIEEASKQQQQQHHHQHQHQQQQHQQNSVVVGQNILSTAATVIDDHLHHDHHQQHQQTLNQSSFLNDHQFRLFESSTSPQIHMNASLPPLTPISRLTRSRKQGTNVMSIQNSQIKTIHNNFSIANNSFKNPEDSLIINEEITKSQQLQQQQRPLQKKNLPHKKRITKKLKIIDRAEQQQQQQQQQPTIKITAIHNGNAGGIQKENTIAVFEEESSTITMPQFTCQLCGAGSDSQLEFFSHLKEHYEPEESIKKISNTINLVQSLPRKHEILSETNFSVSNDDNFNHHHRHQNKTELIEDNKSIIQNEIHHQTSSTIHQHHSTTLHNTNDEPPLHHHQHQHHHSSPSPTTTKDDLQGPEVEFSDTEDMLEGIRGVVDKVQESVDNDSNDCMNLISERSWYSNSALNGTVVTNPTLEEPQVDNFALFNRSDIEKLIEQQEQISLDNASAHDIELPSGNDLEVSMSSVDMPPQTLQLPKSIEHHMTDTGDHGQEEHQEIETTMEQPRNSVEKLKGAARRGRKPKSKGGNKKRPSNVKDDDHSDNHSVVIVASSSVKDEKILDDDGGGSGCGGGSGGDISGSGGVVEEDFKFKSKKKLKCPKCDKFFNSANALKYHDLSHTGERPHQCEICGKSFFAQSALKVHMRLHSGDKPYICQFCNRPFRQWGDLKYHTISIHTDMKSFQCEFCGKAFARRYSLVVHRRIHTCEKNYKCEFCPKSFRASSYLQNHRKIHTGEKPYMCKVCGKKFRVCGDLRRHENIHTRDKRKTTNNSSSKNVKKDNQTINSSLQNDNFEENEKKEFSEAVVKSEVKIETMSCNSQENIIDGKSDTKVTIPNRISMNGENDENNSQHHRRRRQRHHNHHHHQPDTHNIGTTFKTEPNFESSSSSVDATTVNNVNVIELPSSTSSSSSSSSSNQQQTTSFITAIPKRQIIKDNTSNSSNSTSNNHNRLKDSNDDNNCNSNSSLDTTQVMMNKTSFVYFW